MTRQEMTELAEFLEERIVQRIGNDILPKLEERIIYRLETDILPKMEARLEARLEKRLKTWLEHVVIPKMDESFIQYINLSLERFEDREQRLLEAFEGKLEERIKPNKEKVEQQQRDFAVYKLILKDLSKDKKTMSVA